MVQRVSQAQPLQQVCPGGVCKQPAFHLWGPVLAGLEDIGCQAATGQAQMRQFLVSKEVKDVVEHVWLQIMQLQGTPSAGG